MSSVLHPVGPEPRERYWVRRLAVLVAVVVAIGVVIALVGNAMSAGSAVQAEPVAPTILPPAVTSSPTASPTASPSPTASSSASPTPTTTPTGSPTPTSTSTASGKKSTATPSKTPSKAATQDKAKGAKDKAKASKTTQPVYAACDGSDLRPTLTGDRTVKVGKKTTFALSLINGGKKTCTTTVTPSSATLTVVSGGDRIWSTKDCPAAQPTTKRTLLPQHALAWKVTWSGGRSGKGCSTSKVAPKKGYYWAIASFDKADDVRFRVIVG